MMKRFVNLVLAGLVVFAFSSLAFGQQADSTMVRAQKKQSMMMEHKKGSETWHHTKLSKDQVIQLQQALTKAGDYGGKADGIYGKATRQALKKYQKANGLKVNGYADQETLAKLGLSFNTEGTESTPSMQKGQQMQPQPKSPSKPE